MAGASASCADSYHVLTDYHHMAFRVRHIEGNIKLSQLDSFETTY